MAEDTYADARQRFINEHGDLEVKPAWFEQLQNRTYRPPEPLEGPVRTVVNGLTGQQHVVPRNSADIDQPGELPVVRRRPRQRRPWDSVKGEYVSTRKPKELTSIQARKRRNRREEAAAVKAPWSRIEGVAGFREPKSQ